MNVRRRNHFVVENNGQAIVDVVSRDSPERFCAGVGQSQRNFIASLLENRPGARHVLSGEFGPSLDQQLFGLPISALDGGENDVARRCKGRAGCNLPHQLITI